MTELSRGEQLRKNDFEELRSGQLENRKIIEKYQDGSLRSVKKNYYQNVQLGIFPLDKTL